MKRLHVLLRHDRSGHVFFCDNVLFSNVIRSAADMLWSLPHSVRCLAESPVPVVCVCVCVCVCTGMFCERSEQAARAVLSTKQKAAGLS